MGNAVGFAVGGVALLMAGFGAPAAEIKLEQVLSREHPAFRPAGARLTVGRDGRVYLASGGNATCYVLRLDRDGGNRFGGTVVYAVGNATANADGVVATANAHFAHKVALYDRGLNPLASVDDFLNNDTLGWSGPPHVEAGVGGDFYGLDHNRDRIVRLSSEGKLLRVYPAGRDPEGAGGRLWDFRVCEKTEAFYLLPQGGPLRCRGFDGKDRWKLDAGVRWGDQGNAGGFDVDEAGILYAIGPHDDTVRTFGPDGKPRDTLRLEGGAPKPVDGAITELRVYGDDLVVRRRHPTELFRCYDRATGRLKHRAVARHEVVTVIFPQRVWHAGEEMPFAISLTGKDIREGTAGPSWQVRLRSLCGTSDLSAPWDDGRLRVPRDAAGVYLVEVLAEPVSRYTADAPEYRVRTWVEVRRPGAKETISVWTATGRSQFARGEPITGLVRARRGEKVPGRGLTVRLMGQSAVLAEQSLRVDPDGPPTPFTIPAEVTRALAPGSYQLTVEAPPFTVVPQSLFIGPGERGSFDFIQYGDYQALYPSADAPDQPAAAAAHAERARRLGITLFVDRLGVPLQGGAFAAERARAEVQEVLDFLEKDPTATAPEKVRPPMPLGPVLSAYGARGIGQMAILMGNDAGLPLGSGFDPRKPPDLTQTLTRLTKALEPYPAFRGWDWASNWWVFDARGSNAARDPAEKAAYEQALQKAQKTGAWDPVLERVADRRLGMAVEAQDLFNRTLRSLTPHLVTAAPGPYRNVEAYPPITFRNVDEVDLQAQWEQVAVPYHAAHAVDFYKRPGKRAWLHPEIWNDAGTGEQVLPTLFQGLMRGADGVGASGPIPPWGRIPDDSRHGYAGTTSVFRALGELLREYGPWMTTLENSDPAAIVVSGRMLKIDPWPNVTGTHFARLLEAYASCLHAHRPARYVFAEDVKPDGLTHFRAVLVVGQTVELEPALREALAAAARAGVKVFHDATCRADLVRDFAPLGMAFDHFEKDRSPASDDDAYPRFAAVCRENAAALAKSLGGAVPAAAEVDNPEILLSERKAEEGRYLFVVNHTTPDLDPGQMWRMSLFVASRVPVAASVRLGPDARFVYDVFAGKRVEPSGGVVEADCRSLPARLFAILPAAIDNVALEGPGGKVTAGEFIRWRAAVQDAEGKPIRAAIPLHVRLLDAAGRVLEEFRGGTGSRGAVGAMYIPLNAGKGPLTLEATELCSGRSARLMLAVTLREAPINLAAPFSKAEPVATDTAKGQDRSPSWKAVEERFGPHVRDVAVSADGAEVLLSAFNWDHNLYDLDLATGRVRWRQRVGHYFAFAPQALTAGFAVQGFDFRSAEGYHLYLLDRDGKPSRRFALYGLPQRLPHRFVPALLNDRIDNFAAAPDGSWIAAAGDLGLAAWSADGKLRWSEDWWKTRRHTAILLALDRDTLLVVEDRTATARAAGDGRVLWRQEVGDSGTVRAVCATPDGRTCALLATTDGGRVFILKDGKLAATLPAAGDDVALSPDGTQVALVHGTRLNFHNTAGGLRWSLPGDDVLHFPRYSPDGKRIACVSELGTLYVCEASGRPVLERDLGALAVPAWLPGGDLLLAGWMGTVTRLGPDFAPRWTTHLKPEAVDMRGKLLAEAALPTTRVAGWGNAEPRPAALAPNLLSDRTTLVGWKSTSNHVQLVRSGAAMVDGKTEPPPAPWLSWTDVGWFAEGNPFNYLLLDTFRTRLRVEAITLVEDPDHPESWLRDARLDWWDPVRERWETAGQLLSDAATHTHRLPKPVEAARWRIVPPQQVVGNLRLAEIVFHGSVAGPAHPDAQARRPVAVLFDEGDELKEAGMVGHGGLSFAFSGAHSGGRCLRLEAEQSVAPPFRPPFGHVVPTWDFEIAEHPGPGQYRYLQFAWRALSPTTRSLKLRLDGDAYGQAVSCFAGPPEREDDAKARPIRERPPQEWEVVRVDLWEVLKKPVRIRGLRLAARGGPAAFDQILLGRTEKDLPAMPGR